MICLPLSAESNIELAKLIIQSETQPADVLELRLDFLKEPPDFPLLIPAHLPIIVSCRSRNDGGFFAGNEIERRQILMDAAAAGCDYLEVEAIDVKAIEPHKKQAKIIACLHDFHGVPDDLEDRVKKLAALPSDWVKFAVTYRRPADCLRVLGAIKKSEKPCIGIAMGEGGLVTRILGPAVGSPLTYANRDPGFEAAPGSPTAGDLARIYRVNEITTKTKVYGIIGNPIAQSRRYRIMNRAFDYLGIDAVYIPFMCENVTEFLNTMVDPLNIQGLSVTIPHKMAAYKWADHHTVNAKRLASTNTLTRTDEGWRANNSDLSASFESIKSVVDNLGLNLTGAEALVLGAGGTTAAVASALSLVGCKITLAARSPDMAWRIASPMDWDVEDLETAVHMKWNVVANTTSVGMIPNTDESLFPPENWHEGMMAVEVVFNPVRTKFLREAAAAGAITVDGVEMFVRQAAEQFRLWTGREMPKLSTLTWGVR